jgi:hypothetical protein
MQGFTNAKDKQQYIIDADKKAFEKDESAAYFKTLKQYTMISFFTSQEGETKASNYVKIPEEYKGDMGPGCQDSELWKNLVALLR